MKTIGEIQDISIDFQTRKPKITILLDGNEINQVEEYDYDKIKKYKIGLISSVVSGSIIDIGLCKFGV